MEKKLKWKHEPFEIPKEILSEWRKIGLKGEKLESKWRDNLKKKNPEIRKELKEIYTDSSIIKLEKLINNEKSKYFDSKPSLATRQCSSKTIESITSIIPQLIGGSADLSGSNNTSNTFNSF